MRKKYNFIDNKPKGKDLFEGKSQERTPNVISNIIKDNTFQVIGIDGSWGVGKSNLVKIVEEELSDHIFFIYDVWGHQEDEQRRSLLIELTNYLTKKENNFIKKGKWEKKLMFLLSKKKEVTTENLPYLSIGFIFSLIAIIYAPTVTAFKGELSNWLEIESVFWRLVLVLFPIFIVVGIYIWNLLKNWISCNGFWTSFKLSAQETFQIYTNKQKKETKIESISEEEPSVKDFQEWMTEIDNDLNKNLVLVLDNFDRLPKKHILNVWSSIHVFFAEKQYKKIKVIIPFDRKHIKHAFSEFNGDSKTDYADDYINKTFDIVFRVAPPIMSSWKDFFKKNWETAFINFDENEFERVEQAYEILNTTITPRSIVAFINNFISIKLIDGKIPDRYIAIYLLCQEKILDNTLTSITEFDYLKGLEPIYKNDEDFQKYITALAYQIDSDNAIEVVYKNRLRESLVNNKVDSFIEISKTSVFMFIIKSAISDLDDFRNPILVLDHLSEIKKIPQSTIEWIWSTIHEKLRENKLNLGSVENYQLVLLKNLVKSKKRTLLKNILKSLWLESDNFQITDYVASIDKIIKFCDEEKLNLKPLEDLTIYEISAEQLKIIIDIKKEEFKKYKLDCSTEKIDEYLTSLEADNLDMASFCFLIDNPERLVNFNEKLLGFISTHKSNKEVLHKTLNYLKLTSGKKLEINKKITDAEVYSLLNTATQKDSIFIDLAAIRLSFLTSSNSGYQNVYKKVLNIESDEFHKKVAEQVEWYIHYDNLLVGSVSFTNKLMKGVIGEVINLKPNNRKFRAEAIIEKINSIVKTNEIESEQLLSTIEIDDGVNLDEERILKLESSVLLLLKDSQSNIASNVIEVFNNYYKNRSKDEWELSFKDLNCKLFEQLKSIDFVNWNHFALEVFDSLLLKIANDSIIDNNNIVKWLLNSFEKSATNLDNTLKSMRDRLIQNNNVTTEVFALFIQPLIAHAALEDSSNDVVRTIFKTELLDSEECSNMMIDNSERIKMILSKSGKSKDDFRDGLKARIKNEGIQELSRKLGFKIKSESNDSDDQDF
jgi:hypothetical protein